MEWLFAKLFWITHRVWLTHDSIGLGEDGPTHQPIEHATMLRVTPGIHVWRPADLLETAESFLLKVDLPGFDKEDLDIQGTSEYLVIKAVRKDKEESENEDNGQEKTNDFSVSRKINFPVKVTPSKANISLEDGVLSIDMPKSEEAKAVKLYPK